MTVPETICQRDDAHPVRTIGPDDAEWPEQLRSLAVEMPERLWIRGAGSLTQLTRRSVAIVGARAATSYGVWAANDFAYGLGEMGWTVVSGGAYGIDAAAHRAAASASRPTVVVLPCGVSNPYPPAHVGLFDDVLASGGLLVSEVPPETSPSRSLFLSRNRLIAALAPGMVLVEANQRSGSVQAFGWAKRLGRKLMAVPGPITSVMSDGPLRAIRDGATAVGSVRDIVDELQAVSPRVGAAAD